MAGDRTRKIRDGLTDAMDISVMSESRITYSFSELFSPCPHCKIEDLCCYVSAKSGEKICFRCWINEGNNISVVYG